jgi:hypothetical protein
MALIIGLTGCGGAPEQSGVPSGPVPSADPAGEASQQALLTDGTASTADYESAVSALRECLARQDVELVNMGWNPVHHQRMVLYFRNTDMPDDEVSRRGEQCKSSHLTRVEQQYVRNTEPVMDQKLLDLSRQCLSGRGAAVTGTEKNGPDLLRSVTAGKRNTVLECVSRSTAELYPDFPIPVEM